MAGDKQVLIRDQIVECALQLVCTPLVKDSRWRFTDGAGMVRAFMRDQAFLRDVASASRRLRKKDVLIVRLRRRTSIDAKGRLSAQNEILAVTAHRRGAREIEAVPRAGGI